MEIKKKWILILFLTITIGLCFINNTYAQIIKIPKKNQNSICISKLITASLNGRWGIVDDTNKIYVPFLYDSIKYSICGKFNIYKNGKIGLVSDFGELTTDTITYKLEKVVKVLEPNFDSLIRKKLFIKAYRNNLMYIYWYDGSLLFPPAPINSKICRIKLNFIDYKKDNNAYRVLDKKMERFMIDSFMGKTIFTPIIFYNNKYYMLDPIKIPELSVPMTVSEIRLSKYFKRQVRKDKNHCCED